MTKTYLATKQDVQTVSSDVTTINQQLNTPDTGINPRLVAVEGFDDRITQVETDVATIDGDIHNPVSGVIKQLVDIDTEINEAGVGIKARIDDLEQGGTTTTKFRSHSPNGIYQDGEVVLRNGHLFTANGPIDGSVTPVNFVEGTWAWHFTRVEKPTGAVSRIQDDNLLISMAVITDSQGKLVASDKVTSTEVEFLKDINYNIKAAIDGKQAKITAPLRMHFAATITSTGVVSDNYIRTIYCNKISDGIFEIYGFESIDPRYSFVAAESISDDDNVFCVYNRTGSSFRIKWYDMPDMTAQSLNFRLRLVTF